MLDPETFGLTAIKSMKRANERYGEMSHGMWAIDVGTEYWLTVAVAEALWEQFRRSDVDGITVEEPAISLLGEGYFSSDVTVPMLGRSQRIDIVAWKSDQPIAALEVKRAGNNADDVARVACLVLNRPAITLGVVVFAIHGANEKQYRAAYNIHIEYLTQIAATNRVKCCAHGDVSANTPRWLPETKTKNRWLGFGYAAFSAL
jgi:hypothetical protein